MTGKIAAIILDALDEYNVKQLDMEYLNSLITEWNSEVLGCSTLPYTAQSNPMIWGVYYNEDMFWVKPGTDKWSFPAGAFNREEGKAVEKAERTWNREDYDTTFIWDEMNHKGVDVSALHIPIVLPPYSYNPLESFEMGDHWFPHDAEQIRAHAHEMPETIKQHAEAGKSFIAASIQIPDKPLHAMGENSSSQKEAKEICREFDRNMKDLIEKLEEEGYEIYIFGDHGSPWPGNIKIPATKQFAPRHRKSSLIMSNNQDIDLPTYTDELYSFFDERFDVDKSRPSEEEMDSLEEEAIEALKEALKEEAIFMWTGGKEAQVISHMLQERIGEEAGKTRYAVIDTGNHFEEMYEFRNIYAEKHGIDLIKKSFDELLENVILNEEDPRGYHGTWDDDKEIPGQLSGIAEQNASKDQWGVEESCGALKVNGIKHLIEEEGADFLITGQRKTDVTVSEDAGKFNEREEPVRHTRVNPLFEWSKQHVWRYIDRYDVEYCKLYDRGYDHTDAKCCTQKPNDLGEYGQQGVDVETEVAKEKLQDLGYI